LAAVEFKVDFKVTEKGKNAPEYTLESDINGKLSLAAMQDFFKDSLIAISDSVLREEQGRGFDKEAVRLVDGKFGKSKFDVKTFGTIEYVARADIGEALIDMYNEIVIRSPKLTGLYSISHLVLLNGALVARNISEMESFIAREGDFITNGDLIRFVNVTPYAGMLEREGVTAQNRKRVLGKSKDARQRAGPKVRIPNGVYFQTAKKFKRMFKGNFLVFADFINGGGIPDSEKPSNSSRQVAPLRKTFHPDNKRNKGPYVYPSIKVLVKAEGTK
jgi:hypothetical protein